LTGMVGHYYGAQPPRPPRLPLRIMVPIIPEPAGLATVHYSSPSFRWVIPCMVAILAGSGILHSMMKRTRK
jgi:hypothetical protein